MQKFILAICMLLCYSYISAQSTFYITSGTDFYISSGIEFTSNGLSLTPSTGFNINGLMLSKSTTTSNATSNIYASQVYKFNNNTALFSGTIRFYYADSELNGLTETSLQVNVHNGTTWQNISSSINDVMNNFVETNVINNIPLNELALTSNSTPLPLNWGLISAIRQGQEVKIVWNTFQEKNVSHFEVERSFDGRNWNTIVNDIKAKNTEGVRQYTHIDASYQPQQLYYKIKQMDMDGHFTYSKIVSVDEEMVDEKPIIYPNPVINTFYIGNCDPLKIKTVQLFSNNGSILKTWNETQNGYPMQAFANGTYFIKITMTDGSSQQKIMQKQ